MTEKETSKMSLGDLANLLHSSLFSLEKSIQEWMGEEHIIITSHASKYISAIEREKGSRIFSGSTLEEALKNFQDFTSQSEFFEEVDIRREGEEEYLIQIKGCALAKTGVHSALNPEKDICPMALAAGAVFKHSMPDSDVILKPSVFEEDGSRTELLFIRLLK